MNVQQLCINCMSGIGDNKFCPICGSKQEINLDPPYSLPPQTILNGKYILGKTLGYGGFGITYIARDLIADRKVAIKEYLPRDLVTRIAGTTLISIYTGSRQEDFQYGLQKFIEEARNIYKFNTQPNIISVYNLFEENGTAYYVMEYMDGMDLGSYLKQRNNKLSIDESLKIIMSVLDALETIHKYDLIHRDISPDNIYITKGNQVKLFDFGAARYALSQKSISLSVILKPGYAPEEQFRTKGRQGPWTDIYALGATFYRMITGELPPESTERLIEDHIRKPSELGIPIASHVEKALLKAIEVKSDNRFQTVREFRDALSNKPTPAPSVSNVYCSKETDNRYAKQWVYTGFIKRMAAFLIDYLFMVISYFILLGIFEEVEDQVIVYTVLVVFMWLYFTLFESSSKQATPGKLIMKIMVIDYDGYRISFGRATLRYFCKLLSVIGFGYGYIMASFTKRRQTLHDLIAKTLIINKDSFYSTRHQGGRDYINSIPLYNDSVRVQNFYLYGVSGYFAGASFSIDGKGLLIGRDYNRCQIIFPEDALGISGVHCIVRCNEHKIVLSDLNSSYGTFKESGEKIVSGEERVLFEGERFFLGGRNTMFEIKRGEISG